MAQSSRSRRDERTQPDVASTRRLILRSIGASFARRQTLDPQRDRIGEQIQSLVVGGYVEHVIPQHLSGRGKGRREKIKRLTLERRKKENLYNAA